MKAKMLMCVAAGCSVVVAALPPRWQSLTPQAERVAGVNQPVISLNGSWNFSTTADATQKPCEVPGEWAMQGLSVPAGEAAIYEKAITIPADWSGKVVRVRFDSVHAECELFFDGTPIGAHKGGFVPFEMVLPGAAPGLHTLRLVIRSESVSDTLSTVSQYASHQVGGILRDATLFCLPPAHLKALRIETHLPGDVVVRCAVEGTASLALMLKDGDLPVAQAVHAQAEGCIETTLTVEHPKLWTNEAPHRYTLSWVLQQGGQVVAEGSQRVGIREVRVEGNRLLINNHPVKLMGVNRHEVHPLLGRATTKELAWQDAALFKEANVTCVRTSHYPPSPHFLEACDELGIFVESEAALCWIQHHANPVWRNGWNYLDKQYLPYLLEANLDQIRAYANHPCLILWSLGNESCWSPLWEEVNRTVKAADPTRPTAFHDQCWGSFNNAGSMADIANHHYPSEANAHMWSEKGRPVWFGEYAHVQCYNRRELETDPGIREDWGRPLARMVDLMWTQPGCLGGAIWSGIDDVFHLPDGSIKGYGHWGIIDAWRRKKPEYIGVQHAYAPIRITRLPSTDEKMVHFAIENRHNFTALTGQLHYSFANTKRNTSGTLPLAIPPHASKSCSIAVPELADGSTVALTILQKGNERPIHTEKQKLSAFKSFSGLTGQPRTLTPEGGLKVWSTIYAPPVPFLLPLNGEGGAAGPAGTVLSAEIKPFTPVEPFTWRATDDPNRFTGENNQVTATLTYAEQTNGYLRVDYALTAKVAVNPRQWGLVFTFPTTFHTLSWSAERGARSYPEDQIGRPYGEAISYNPGPIRLSPEERAKREAHPWFNPPGGFDSPRYHYPERGPLDSRKPVTTPWYHDCNALGPADFRATKRDVSSVLLENRDYAKFIVIPAAPDSLLPAVRAWVDGDCTRLLIAGFNTGGSDGFFATHYAAERRPVKPGDELKGAFLIRTAR